MANPGVSSKETEQEQHNWTKEKKKKVLHFVQIVNYFNQTVHNTCRPGEFNQRQLDFFLIFEDVLLLLQKESPVQMGKL